MIVLIVQIVQLYKLYKMYNCTNCTKCTNFGTQNPPNVMFTMCLARRAHQKFEIVSEWPRPEFPCLLPHSCAL